MLEKYLKRKFKQFLVGICLLLSVIIFPFLTGLYPTVRFPREYIDVHIFPGHITVEARYVYKNPFPFPVVQGFYYPLPVDEHHPMPEDVYAEEIAPNAIPIPISYLFGRHLFEKFFWGGEESIIQVTYDQPSLDKTGTYIITTTKEWRRPLNYADYRLFPHGVKIKTSNYELTPNKNGYHSFERKEFMPTEDWKFDWNR